MNPRVLFLLTAISGMIGMLALIALSLCRYWLVENPPHNLSDTGLDQWITIARGSAVAMLLSKAAITSFVIFLTLYLIARSTNKAKPAS